jgi:hypothetical protein
MHKASRCAAAGLSLLVCVVFLPCARAVAFQATRDAQGEALIACEVRAFDGSVDITPEAGIRVFQSGKRDSPLPVKAGTPLALAPGYYDIHVARLRDGRVVSIRWAEHVLVTRYPGEGGRRVDVVNFKDGFGALQLAAGRQPGGERHWRASAFPPGNQMREVGAASYGDGYLLLVLPAGRYDVRLTDDRSPGERWLSDVEVVADRTTVKTLEETR